VFFCGHHHPRPPILMNLFLSWSNAPRDTSVILIDRHFLRHQAPNWRGAAAALPFSVGDASSEFPCVACVGGSVVSVHRWRSIRRPHTDPSRRLGVAFVVGGVWFGGGGYIKRPNIPCADYPGYAVLLPFSAQCSRLW